MKRRQFIAGLGSAAAWPVAARAQQRGLPVVGFLSVGVEGAGVGNPASFRKGLSETGFIEDRNVTIEYRAIGRCGGLGRRQGRHLQVEGLSP